MSVTLFPSYLRIDSCAISTHLAWLWLVVCWVESRSFLAVVRDRPLAFAELLGLWFGVGGGHLVGCSDTLDSPGSEYTEDESSE